jgi:hypothetical protein
MFCSSHNLVIAQACREAALKRASIAKKQLLVPPAKAGGKEKPAKARLKIAPKTDVRFLRFKT